MHEDQVIVISFCYSSSGKIKIKIYIIKECLVPSDCLPSGDLRGKGK